MTTTTFVVNSNPLTPKQIIQRLYDKEEIDFEEMCTLLEAIRKDYTPPYVPDYPQWPINPYPVYVDTSGTAKPVDPRAPSTCTSPYPINATYSSQQTGKYDDLKPELTVKDGL